MDQSIVFVGGGNMATALISGLRAADTAGGAITVIEPDADKRAALTADYVVRTLAQATTDTLAADVLVLAVKPQIIAAVAHELAGQLGAAKPLVISIAAGVPLAGLKQWLGPDLAYIRCMPNTPALIGAGATALYAEDSVNADQRELAERMLATAGITAWVDSEAALDAVTATSGSGPAYFFAFMEAMVVGAEALGLDGQTARTLVLQTALGAARMVNESSDDPATLRQKVTSPGGTTEAALQQFNEGDLKALVAHAMAAAAQRADTLAQELLQRP
jgi:pyrroline-5-carboxylate reductase